MKKIYLIGKDINYSKSPLLQNAMLKELGRFDVEYEIKNLEEDERDTRSCRKGKSQDKKIFWNKYLG